MYGQGLQYGMTNLVIEEVNTDDMEIIKLFVSLAGIAGCVSAIDCDKELKYHEDYGYGFDISCDGLNQENEKLLKDISVYNEILLSINNSTLKNLTSELFMNVQKIRQLVITNSSLNYKPGEAPFRNLAHLEHITIANSKLNNLDEHTFQNLTNLREINLQNDSLKIIKPNSIDFLKNLQTLTLTGNKFGNLSHVPLCQLTSLRHLFVDRNQISSLNDDFLCVNAQSENKVLNLVEIDLSFNRINDIDSFANAYKVKYINLEGNLIENIDDKVFDMLTKLEKLNLKNNRLKHITSHAFNDLANLKFIDLSNNLLENVYLETLPQLEYIDLSVNRITATYLNNLYNLPKVKTLNFNRNSFRGIVDSFVQKFPLLEFLDLSTNQILLTNDTFRNSTNLKDLKIRNNNLQTIPPYTLKPLINLEILDLSHNKISDAFINNPNLLVNLENLQVLNLSYNSIESLNYEEINMLHNLQVLDIAGNRLQNFQFNLISSLPSLRVINIKSNIISCDTLSNIIMFLKTKHITFNINEELAYDKKNIAGIYCEEIKLNENINGGFSVGSVFLILFIIIISIALTSLITYKFIQYSRRRNYIMDEIELIED